MQYSGSLTREQFMFQEMRMVARLKLEELDDQSILKRVYEENLFQYPTEREIKSKCRACLKRLSCLIDIPYAIDALANGSIGEAKQAALVALMCQSLLMQDFMITVIGDMEQLLTPVAPDQPNQPKLRINTLRRYDVLPQKKLSSEAEIDQYVAALKETLMDALKDHDAIQLN